MHAHEHPRRRRDIFQVFPDKVHLRPGESSIIVPRPFHAFGLLALSRGVDIDDIVEHQIMITAYVQRIVFRTERLPEQMPCIEIGIVCGDGRVIVMVAGNAV